MRPVSRRREDRAGSIVAIEGVSGAGKSRLARALARSASAPLLPEAWRRLRPRPSLGFADERELEELERRLLSEEFERWREAVELATEAPLVVCDTGFAGPLTYTLGLDRLDPVYGPVRRSLLRLARRAAAADRWGVPDAVLFVDTPLRLANLRAARASATHPVRWRARHAAVGRLERAFWIGGYASVAPRRLFVLDGRDREAALIARARKLLSQPLRRSGPGEARRALVALSR